MTPNDRVPSPPGGWGRPPAEPGPAPAWGAPPPRDGPDRPLVLRPMNLGDLLDGAFKLFVRNWRTVLIVSGVFLAPLYLLTSWLQRDLYGGTLLDMLSDPATTQQFMEGGGIGEDLAALVTTMSTVLVLPFIAGAVSKVVAASYLGEQLDAGPALRAAGRRWWALVASRVLVYLCEALPFLLATAVLVAGIVTQTTALIVVGVVAMIAAIPAALLMMALFVATAPAIVVENLGAVRGMRRSAGLMRPRLLAVLLAAVVAGVLASLLSGILGGIPATLGLFFGDRFGWIVVAFGSLVGGLLTTPFVAIVATLIYFDGRIRHEAFDLQAMAATLGPGERSTEPPHPGA